MINGFINKIQRFINKIGKINFYLLVVLFFSIVIMGLYQTFSMQTINNGVSYSSNIKTYSFVLGDDSTTQVIVRGNDSKYIDILITNSKDIDLLYSLYYNLENESDDVIVGYLEDTSAAVSGVITKNNKLIVSLKIINNSNDDKKVDLGIVSGTVSGGDLRILGKKVSTLIHNLDTASVNVPLLSDSLIPVYYNYLDNNWYKADFSNTNPSHKWYDYGEEAHEWANAIVVSDNTRDYYLNSRVGTRINNVDILAFFVWIPRYKYHLWNSSRKVSSDYDYSYNAYKFGIDVKFENGTSSTGNINCSYNSVIDEGDNNLSDVCSFQGNVLSNSDNGSSDYWYTHPAFSPDLTGFWMGKFETGGNFTDPTILPDTISIRNINVSNQFKVMKNFDKYISSDDLSAGMVSNLEWGAVSYLTYSKYGVCSSFLCSDVYINNAIKGYTGRSAGTVASLFNESDYGNYSYDGYKLSGEKKTNERDLTKVASTTRNIYGVYDMVGGAYEYVMANMLDKDKRFNSNKAGSDWNGSKYLSSNYYNVYSYGVSFDNQAAFSRARLGDATSEVTFNIDGKVSAWSFNNDANFVSSVFLNNDKNWFIRGGTVNKNAGLFNYDVSNGDKNINYSFRIVLS